MCMFFHIYHVKILSNLDKNIYFTEKFASFFRITKIRCDIKISSYITCSHITNLAFLCGCMGGYGCVGGMVGGWDGEYVCVCGKFDLFISLLFHMIKRKRIFDC